LKNLQPHQEQTLVNLIAKGDQQAYTQVYEAYQPMLFNVAFSLLKIRSAAEDVCNDVFTLLWEKRSTLNEIVSLKAYLLTSVRNRSINALKYISRQEALKQQISRSFPGVSMETEAAVLHREYMYFIKIASLVSY